MKKLAKLAVCLILAFAGLSALADVYVKGYYRRDGTYVRPHYRSSPDGNFNNNWSTKGNVNPYTGRPGTLTSPSIGDYVSPGPYYPQPVYNPQPIFTPQPIYNPHSTRNAGAKTYVRPLRPPSVKVLEKRQPIRKKIPDPPKKEIFAPRTTEGKVVGVIDGDTIEVMINGKAEKIRLYGVDCPESGQAFGTQAKKFTSDACFGKTVTVEITDVDKYGRFIGTVRYPNGSTLNEALLAAGMAWWYKEYAPEAWNLMDLQVQAMETDAGLWVDTAPLAPWDFRSK